MKIIIRYMERKCVVEDTDYDWVQRHINDELQVCAFNWTSDGTPFSVKLAHGPIIFLYDGGIRYESYLC